jgi:metal-responsive CopG/Arc/MetJ family transcriptional regulator
MPVRTTIRLDERVLDRLRPFVRPRGLSRFINEAMAEKLAALERERLEAEMREGYIATREDRAELNVDWSVVDFEAWPE